MLFSYYEKKFIYFFQPWFLNVWFLQILKELKDIHLSVNIQLIAQFSRLFIPHGTYHLNRGVIHQCCTYHDTKNLDMYLYDIKSYAFDDM